MASPYDTAALFASGEKGLYLLALEAQCSLEVGRLGELPFDGWYVYVGSAQGPGGLKRLQRHFAYPQRAGAPRRWHIDALLACGALRCAVACVTDQRLECRLAQGLGRMLAPAFKGFGSSDCPCPTHLFSSADRRSSEDASRLAMAQLGLEPWLVDAGDALPR